MLNRISRKPQRHRAGLAGVLVLLLAALGMASLTGAAAAAPSSQDSKGKVTPTAVGQQAIGIEAVPGNWLLAFDWGCDGSYSTIELVFNADGTWSDTGGFNRGPWASAAGMLMFTFDNPPARTVYAGNIASKSVTGTQTTFGGGDGCFYMLQSGTPRVMQLQKDSADMAGKAAKS